MQLQLIRNATLKLQFGGRRVLIDPFLAPMHSIQSFVGVSENPTVDIPISIPEIIEDAEVTFLSHLHVDHFDKLAQERLRKSVPIFCQPTDRETIQKAGFVNVSAVDKDATWDNVKISRTPAQHGSGQWIEKMGHVSGYVLEAEGEPSVYLMGDTILYEPVTEVIERKRPKVIVTHSGGANFDGTPIIMDAEQTIAVCEQAPWATVIAVHMDSLDHCPVTRAALKRNAEDKGITNLRIPADGESMLLS